LGKGVLPERANFQGEVGKEGCHLAGQEEMLGANVLRGTLHIARIIERTPLEAFKISSRWMVQHWAHGRRFWVKYEALCREIPGSRLPIFIAAVGHDKKPAEPAKHLQTGSPEAHQLWAAGGQYRYQQADPPEWTSWSWKHPSMPEHWMRSKTGNEGGQRRKMAWDLISTLVRGGLTAQVVLNQSEIWPLWWSQ
jgi:hypothetical protein